MPGKRSNAPPGVWNGLRVLELADEKVHLCGKLFADSGADVVLIEPPGGCPSRSIGPFVDDTPGADRSLFFWQYNTGKQSVTMDLASPGGRDAFAALAAKADLLIEGTEPGYLKRIGLDYTKLSKLNPRLIMVAITPFGQTGPYARWKTTELVSIAIGGLMDNCGYDPPIPPIRPGDYQAWHTGCNYAYIAATASLVWREQHGTGDYLDCSIHDALCCTTESSLHYYLYGKKRVYRGRGRYATIYPVPSNTYRCADKGYLYMMPGIGSGVYMYQDMKKLWQTWLDWLEPDGLAEDLKDPRYWDPVERETDAYLIDQRIREFCALHPAQWVFEEAQKRGIVCGRIMAPHDLFEDPHYKANDFFIPVRHQELGRTVLYPGAPFSLPAAPWRISRRPPLVGEHTGEVLGSALRYHKRRPAKSGKK